MPRGRPRKNPLVAAAQVQASDLIKREDKPKELPEPRDIREFLGMPAEIAQDIIYIRNTRIPNAREHFPTEPLLRTVEKYFPQAKGGPIYIDEPVTLREVGECERKAEVMKKEGCRYVYITPEMELEDALKQLEDQRGVA